MIHALRTLLAAGLALAALSSSGGASAFDEAAAKSMAKKNDCTKCHAIDKDKRGPSYKKIAAKYAGKADAEEKLGKFIASNNKVKLPDGSEEEHKMIDGKDAKDAKNLLQWILAQ